MGATLVIFFVSAFYLRAESVTFSSSSASTTEPDTLQRIPKTFCDEDAEFANLSCMSSRDHEQLFSGILKHGLARMLSPSLITGATMIIGKEELRKSLNISPPHPWAPYNFTKPSEEELALAPTVEAYFDLREPRQKMHSLDSLYFYEHNFPPAIAFLDNRFPVIRTAFRCRFEKMRRLDAAVTERREIDIMIDGFAAFYDEIQRAIRPIYSSRCLEE